MVCAIIAFPGSNCQRDVVVALRDISGVKPLIVSCDDHHLPKADFYVLPGGFSWGDYLRPGAIAARANIIDSLRIQADRGAPILGICNGFQILIECGLLPGTLIRNYHERFVCRLVALTAVNRTSPFTRTIATDSKITFPIAHHDGAFFAPDDTLDKLEENDQIAFRYVEDNPNGSKRLIAGILNQAGNILGLMPHPERRIHTHHGGTDGADFFVRLLENIR